MAIPSESLEVQIESPVDFASLNRNGMNLDALMAAQELFPYFHMLNGPTYVELVKDFWARAEVYDEKLQSIGIDASDDYFMEKLAEVRQLADSESASIASVSEALVQVTQTSNLPLIIPSPVPLSNDSDIDDVPIGQRMRKLSKPSPQPQQITPQLPLQAEQSSAAAECTGDPEDPPTSDLP